MESLEEPQHLQGGGAVEVAGRLVGQHELRLVGESPGDRHPLALTTRERRREVLGAIGEPDLFEQLFGTASRRPGSASGEKRR